MVNRHRRQESSDTMTVFAYVTGPDVILVLADRVSPVVTTNAVAGHVGMIEGCRYPAIRRMTVIAGVAAGDVALVFAGCDCAVVTRRTSTDDLGVIHCVGRSE